MVNRGQVLLGYSSLDLVSSKGKFSFPYFFRFVNVSRHLSADHIVFTLEHLKEIGSDIFK